MTIRTTLIASSLIAASLISGTAQAALQGRDLNGSVGSFEAYYDTVLDITWLADANYAKTSGYDVDGRMTWAAANTWAANLSFYNPFTNQTFADWRLPDVKPVNGTSFNYSFGFDGSGEVGYNIASPQSEMAHLFYVTLGNPSIYTPSGAPSGCYVGSGDSCLDNIGPFSNVSSYLYESLIFWSAPEYGLNPSDALFYDMRFGYQYASNVENSFRAWAVSPGDVAAVPEAQTYALMLAGLGLIGWRARRRG